MSKHCPACKSTNPALFKATIFDNNGTARTLHLCESHDLELFKIGQLRFTLKYNISLGTDALTELLTPNDDQVFADIE